jgi:membrane associated rhomboid family serine protease
VTPVLIAACGLVYIAQKLLDGTQGPPRFTSRFWVGGPDGLDPLTLVTYQFLHGDLLHLLGNMLFLWVFGRAVEDKLGRLGFTAFYLLGGAFAGLMHALFEPAPAVGASGSISAVTGAFLVLFPRTRIKVLWFFILISFLQAPAWFFIGLQVAWNLLAQASGTAGNVAVLAHLSGYAYGFVVALTLLWTGVLSREPYDLFTISKQAKRRRAFRALNEQRPRPAVTPTRRGRAGEGVAEAIAAARAAVSREISAGKLGDAVEPYRLLIDRHGENASAVTLARNAQYRLGLRPRGDRRERAGGAGAR